MYLQTMKDLGFGVKDQRFVLKFRYTCIFLCKIGIRPKVVLLNPMGKLLAISIHHHAMVIHTKYQDLCIKFKEEKSF